MTFETLYSQEDASVNFTAVTEDNGRWEARYVQRTPEYFIAYLSSHTGCNLTCRFCHLTATNQRMMRPASIEDYVTQFSHILAHYEKRLSEGMAPVKWLHVNFMARGDVMHNPVMVKDSDSLYTCLTALAATVGISDVRFKLSSILPREGNWKLEDMLRDPRTELYYSLYSVDASFRKRWLPHAMNPHVALEKIAAYQASECGQRITIHHAFIAGQNDSVESVQAAIQAIRLHGVQAKFNLVRYNPYDARYGQEPDDATLQARFQQMVDGLGLSASASRIVPRVGFDVAASCGCFLTPP